MDFGQLEDFNRGGARKDYYENYMAEFEGRPIKRAPQSSGASEPKRRPKKEKKAQKKSEKDDDI